MTVKIAQNKRPRRCSGILLLLSFAAMACGAVLTACSPGKETASGEITLSSGAQPSSTSSAEPAEPSESVAVDSDIKVTISEHIDSFLSLIAARDIHGLASFIGDDTAYAGDLAEYAEYVYAYYQYYNQEGVTIQIYYSEDDSGEFSVHANIDAISNGNRIDGRCADGKAVIIFTHIGVQQETIAIPVVEGEHMLSTVKRWAEAWRQAVLALPEFSSYHVSDFVIRDVSEAADNASFPESPPAYGIGYAVKSPDESIPWIAGSGTYGTGEWDGWILNGGGIFLYEQDGYWRTDGMWTGR